MSETIYTPAQLSERLGITPSMVRRYGLAYETVMGEALPRDKKSHARLYDDQARSILEQARGVVRENPNLSAEDAIRACLGIVTAPVPPTMPAVAVGEVLELLRAQGRVLERVEARMEALEAENRFMREQLAALPEPRGEALAEPADHDLVADLKRRNAYLEGELKRRDAEAAPRRSWWPWGRKG
jgi:hypothetical protein